MWKLLNVRGLGWFCVRGLVTVIMAIEQKLTNGPVYKYTMVYLRDGGVLSLVNNSRILEKFVKVGYILKDKHKFISDYWCCIQIFKNVISLSNLQMELVILLLEQMLSSMTLQKENRYCRHYRWIDHKYYQLEL